MVNVFASEMKRSLL